MNTADELERLHHLKEKGVISDEEYRQAKAQVLNGGQPHAHTHSNDLGLNDEKTWGMLLHLSLLLGFSALGLIIPILIWQLKKDQSAVIDAHGKVVVNWLLTALILGLIFGIACLIFVGIPLLIALGICNIAFPIVGAIKANSGEVWQYPLSFTFFK